MASEKVYLYVSGHQRIISGEIKGRGVDVVLHWKAKKSFRLVCLCAKDAGTSAFLRKPCYCTSYSCTRRAPQLLWGSSCFAAKTPLKAVEDQELGRRRRMVSVLLSGFFGSHDVDWDHHENPQCLTNIKEKNDIKTPHPYFASVSNSKTFEYINVQNIRTTKNSE
ncbi:hypothetical protein CDAR_492921 [Caerostris darwini]|uniref:Uncharacterized protein n=1 Tax=Caerostris darwini TaxID=1538125 RepID=A0AAV4TD55_9ARAC|nr:hypothetical protein CDAR_492921 [Caerostris darwini]